VVGYFQINTVGSRRIVSWYSRSMENESFPFDDKKFASTELVRPVFDDTELEPGVPLRRVTLKASVGQFKFRPGQPPRPRRSSGDRTGGRSGWPVASEPKSIASPSILIQCAAHTERRDAALAALDADLAKKLDELTEQSRANLAGMRDYLLLISVCLFT